MNISYHGQQPPSTERSSRSANASSDLAGSVVEGHPGGFRACFHHDKRKQSCLAQSFVAPMSDLIDCEES